MKLFVFLFFLVPNIVFSNEINEKFEKIFDLKLTSNSILNSFYLEKPSFILAYLHSNDLFLTNHYKVKLINDKSLKIGFGNLKFIKSNNNNYFFDISIDSVGNAEIVIVINNILNTADILIEKKFKGKFSENLIMRVKKKLSTIFSIRMQGVIGEMISSDINKFGTLEQAIIINDFNRKITSNGFLMGQNIRDQHVFQLLAIFLIIFILMLFRNRIKR